MQHRYSLALALAVSACEPPQPPPSPPAESWSNETEAIFQHAEALKYAVEQHRLEEARLQELGVEGGAPVLHPPQGQTQQQAQPQQDQ